MVAKHATGVPEFPAALVQCTGRVKPAVTVANKTGIAVPNREILVIFRQL